jgi:hypothetical protein
MDPNEALRIIRATIKQMRVENPIGAVTSGTTIGLFIQHAVDLGQAVNELDEWLSRDGFLPADWASDDEKTKPGWVDRVLATTAEWTDEEFELAFGFSREESTAEELCTIEHGDWTGPHRRISSCPEPGYDPYGGEKHRVYEEN